MVDEGTIIGGTSAPAGTKPGERVMAYYHGNVQNGFEILTYDLSKLTTYMANVRANPSAAGEAPYTVSVYEVQGQDQPYTRAYLSVYSHSDGQLGSGGVDVTVHLFGHR